MDPAAEARGLMFALYATLGAIAIILLLTVFPDAPLRDPETGDIIGTSPFMDSLIFLITLVFLAAGVGFGIGARTIKSSNDVIAGVTKTFASLAGLIFMLLIISQFIAQFNYTNMPTLLATGLYVIPQVNTIQAEVKGPVADLPVTDPRRVEFDRLHGFSNILFSITAIGGLALCWWEARE